jgi:hypothetical protein
MAPGECPERQMGADFKSDKFPVRAYSSSEISAEIEQLSIYWRGFQ